MSALVFSSCGGDVVYNATSALNSAQIDRLRQILSDEISAASTVGATKHAQAAKTLLMQLAVADSECARWRAASGASYQQGPA